MLGVILFTLFIFMIFSILKGFFKFVLPVLLLLFLLKLLFGSVLLLFSWHFWELILVVAFFGWLITTVRRQGR